MTVRVSLYSILRELIGSSEISINLEEGSTALDLIRTLGEQWPSAASYFSMSRVAVRDEYVEEKTLLSDGDMIALITPVSGG